MHIIPLPMVGWVGGEIPLPIPLPMVGWVGGEIPLPMVGWVGGEMHIMAKLSPASAEPGN